MFFNVPTPPLTHTATTIVQPAQPGIGNLKKQAYQVIDKNESYDISTGVIINSQKNNTNSLVSHNVDTEHFAASLNKVPVSVMLLEKLRSGEITLDTVVTWDESDRRGGAGVFDAPDAPTSGTVREVLKDLLHYSGNTAVRIAVNNILGGAPFVNEQWKSQYNLQNTYLVPLEGPGQRFYLGYTTPRETLRMFEQLVAGGDAYSTLVREYMATNIWNEMGVRSVLGDSTVIQLTNKIGVLDDPEGNNRHDIGMVINNRTGATYTYAFLETAPNEVEGATAQADTALQQLGTIVLRSAGDKTAGSPNAKNHGQAKQQYRLETGRPLY